MLELTNPATGQPGASFKADTADTINAKVATARAFQKEWAQSTLAEPQGRHHTLSCAPRGERRHPG